MHAVCYGQVYVNRIASCVNVCGIIVNFPLHKYE